MARSDLWTREQLIMALNVYFKIPFKDVKEKHPLIQKYAPLIGRTPTALKMKIGNFGRLDPTLKAKKITGLMHGSFAEEPIWQEFWGNLDKLAFESERLLAERAGKYREAEPTPLCILKARRHLVNGIVEYTRDFCVRSFCFLVHIHAYACTFPRILTRTRAYTRIYNI